MFPRYLFATASGVGVTFVLFMLMQSLIESDQQPFEEKPANPPVEIVRLLEDIEITKTRRPPEPPPEPDEPPPHLPEPDFESDNNGLGVEFPTQDRKPPIGVPRPGGFSEGEALPIVKVAPVYPSQAKRRGIEGYALVEFAITTSGAVRDPRVVESSPPGVFDRASIAAALKFKYKPKVVNGQPIALHGVRNLFTYELSDG